MSPTYKYDIEKYNGKNRYTCPNCGKKKCFARYINADGDYFGENIGICDHIVSCQYDKRPSFDESFGIIKPIKKFVKPPISYLPYSDLPTGRYHGNLWNFLCKKFKENKVIAVYERYDIRVDNSIWELSEVFPQIDIEGRYRTAKIINYNPDTGKRIKEPYPRINWMHKNYDGFVLEQCLFGEHLLNEIEFYEPIFLLESEKAAIICSLFYPDITFLATGGMNNISKEKLAVLRDRNVTAMPDKGAYQYWKEKLEPFNIKVADGLENDPALEVGEGYDDLLMKLMN